MIYLTFVVRGLLDPVFSFKDEQKKRARLQTNNNMYRLTEMQFQWAMLLYYSIVMRTITLHTIHVGALENYTKSNNMKVVNRTLMGNRGHGKKKCNCYFC